LKLLALIPARGGSKGVPRKNIKLLGGKPLLWYSYESARESGLFTEIVLSTEDTEIAETGKRLGMMVPFIRPAEFATDAAKSIDVVNHAIDEMAKLGYTYDAVVLLQPTSPFREKGILNKALQAFIDTQADSLVSVRKVPHQFNPHWLFEADENNLLRIATGDKELIGRRQELPDAYYRDGQIYITLTEVLTQKRSFVGNRLSYIVNESEASLVNIDNMDDWHRAEQFIAQ
jgi:CMP-N,N'-diacetyllegionaminic acid synthase